MAQKLEASEFLGSLCLLNETQSLLLTAATESAVLCCVRSVPFTLRAETSRAHASCLRASRRASSARRRLLPARSNQRLAESCAASRSFVRVCMTVLLSSPARTIEYPLQKQTPAHAGVCRKRNRKTTCRASSHHACARWRVTLRPFRQARKQDRRRARVRPRCR